MVEIVEKTDEEVSTFLPQHLNLEMDSLRSQRKQEADEMGLVDVENLLTPQVSGEYFNEDEVSSVTLTRQRLPCQDPMLNLVEEIEFILPVIASAQTANEEEEVTESAHTSIDADKSVLVTEAEKETCLNQEEQMGDGLTITDVSTAEEDTEINDASTAAGGSEVMERWRYETVGDEQETAVTYKDDSDMIEIELKTVTIAEDIVHLVLCTEVITDDGTQTESEVVLPTSESVLTFPITDIKEEGRDQCMEVEESDMTVTETAEETQRITLHVENENVSAETVEMMLPIDENDAALLTSDVRSTICVEGDEIQKTLHDEVLSETANTVDEDADDVHVVQEFHKQVKMEKRESTISSAAATGSAFTHLEGEQYGLLLPEEAAGSAVTTCLQKVETQQAADSMKGEVEFAVTSQDFGHFESETAVDFAEIKTSEQPILIVPIATELQGYRITKQDRGQKEPSVQQSVTQSPATATAEMSQAIETVADSADEMQVEMSALYLSVKDETVADVTDVADESEMKVFHHAARENEVRNVAIDTQREQEALMIVPQVTGRTATSVPSVRSESDGQDDRVIETLRPVVCENEFATEDSKLSVSGPKEIKEEVKISMKTDTDLAESGTAYGPEVIPEQLLKEASDSETYEKVEAVKPLIEKAVTEAMVFSSETEHGIDLFTFQQTSDLCDDAGIASSQMAKPSSVFEDEIVGEPFENKQKEITKVVRFMSLEIQDRETEVTAINTEAHTVVTLAEDEHLCETTTAGDDVVTMQFIPEYVVDETEASYIAFPALPADGSVPDATSNGAAVCDETHQDTFDHDTLGFFKVSAAQSVMVDATCTIPNVVQPDPYVPYVCSVIVPSSDTRAQDNDSVDHLSGSLVEKFVISSAHITKTYPSGEDNSTLSLNEELSCDNLTVVFPEKVDSPLLSDTASCSITKTQAVDLTERSSLFDSILLRNAEEDELQRDGNAEHLFQLQTSSVESAAIPTRLSDERDTLCTLAEKPQLSETISPDTKDAESLSIDNKTFQEPVDDGDTVVRIPLTASCSDDDHSLQTDALDSEVLPDTHFAGSELSSVSEKSADGPSDRIATDGKVDKPDKFEEDVLQLSTLQVSLCDGTLVQIVCEAEDWGSSDSVPVMEDVLDKVDSLHRKEPLTLVTPDTAGDGVYTDDTENLLSTSEYDQSFDASRVTSSDIQSLQPTYRDDSSLPSQEFLADMQTQQLEASVATQSVSDNIYSETVSGKKEHGVDTETGGGTTARDAELVAQDVEERVPVIQHAEEDVEKPEATSCETETLTEAVRDETEATEGRETVNMKAIPYKVNADDIQLCASALMENADTCTGTLQSEDEAKSFADLPWGMLSAGLLGDESTISALLPDSISKEDDRCRGSEASGVEREMRVEDKAVGDDKPAIKSSVVTRRVQKVSADGSVVERVKSEEVPTSFGPASLTLYFFGGDLPSSPDFSPQSDRQTSAGSIKVYTDTVEGEPWIERRVDERKETRPDGATVTRKVVRVRKRRTIVKHIVIEGPEFEEEVVLDEDAATTAAETSTDEQLKTSANERQTTHLYSEADSAARELSDIAVGNEDDCCVRLNVVVEAGDTESVDKPCSRATDKAGELAAGSEDTTSPRLSAVSLELSRSGDGRAGHGGETDTSGRVGDGDAMDGVESASSCADCASAGTSGRANDHS